MPTPPTPPHAQGVEDVMNAWVDWFNAQDGGPYSVLAMPAYKWAPPQEPYAGAYPIWIVTAQDQTTVPETGSTVIESGTYTLFWVDAMGADYTSLGDLLSHATIVADALERALAAERQAAMSNLLGAVWWAGLGAGVTKAFTARVSDTDENNTPIYALPITVEVREFAKDG